MTRHQRNSSLLRAGANRLRAGANRSHSTWPQGAWRAAAISLALWTCLLATGCGLVLNPDDYSSSGAAGDGGGQDSSGNPSVDAGTLSTALCERWQPVYREACDVQLPGALAAVLSQNVTYTLDTDLGTITPPLDPSNQGTLEYATVDIGTRSVFVLVVNSLSIESGAKLRAVGSLPLVIFARSGISVVNGYIDVSSSIEESPMGGAGHGIERSTFCIISNRGGRSGGIVAPPLPGGGGGGFFTQGGKGGATEIGAEPKDPGMPGLSVPLPLTELVGGCNGGNGGTGNGKIVSPAPGGNGGGAVYLISQGEILLEGAIVNAGGAGGAGAIPSMDPISAAGGGGGGGSGGLIFLDAPVVNILSSSGLWAVGGGGGGGSNLTGEGQPGEDGAMLPGRGGTGAIGRTPADKAGDGGGGGVSGMPGQDGSTAFTSTIGSGGGGGGAGYILIRARERNLDGADYAPPYIEIDGTGQQAP